MTEEIAAIPTVYRGRRFRSRLEARWAAFFDLIGWRWEYESRDCAGWIPDFELLGAGAAALAEVKPITRFDLVTADEITGARPRDTHAILLLGAVLHEYSGCINIGWSVCWDPELAMPGQWRPIPIHQHRLTGAFDIVVAGKPYQGLLSGQNFDAATGQVEPRCADKLAPLWAEAGNLTQWRAA